ncbi:hypothetical protein LTR66_016463, partial [Elasticomyces elasticus]
NSLPTRPPQPTQTAPKCPVAHRGLPVEEMEKDFTTQGKPSNLSCPFASMVKTSFLDPDATIDPIAAEFHADHMSAQSIEASQTCGRCPIRFLDKHSPEEIAQYFENHKHEIPRSHEVCVKRYQQNDTQIRELDERYGNLVSMIQGLGNKHKRYLPNEALQALGSSGFDPENHGVVEKWADNVDGHADDDEVEMQAPGAERGEERVSHFDKPMREVRVGESPTRPWGISMPIDQALVMSARVSSVTDLPSRGAKVMKEQTQAQNILDHEPKVRATSYTSSRRTKSSHRSIRSRQPSTNTTIIFNGPVFIGYPPDQAARFLKQLGVDKETA